MNIKAELRKEMKEINYYCDKCHYKILSWKSISRRLQYCPSCGDKIKIYDIRKDRKLKLKRLNECSTI